MSAERRKYQRFPLTLDTQRVDKNGGSNTVRVLEMSVGGCFIEWFEDARLGDNFRLKIPLAKGSSLPLECKIIYRFTNAGVGVKFLDITPFEQQLLAEAIRFQMRKQGLPERDPLLPPSEFAETENPKLAAVVIDVA